MKLSEKEKSDFLEKLNTFLGMDYDSTSFFKLFMNRALTQISKKIMNFQSDDKKMMEAIKAIQLKVEKGVKSNLICTDLVFAILYDVVPTFKEIFESNVFFLSYCYLNSFLPDDMIVFFFAIFSP
jgi:hypothetical protein